MSLTTGLLDASVHQVAAPNVAAGDAAQVSLAPNLHGGHDAADLQVGYSYDELHDLTDDERELFGCSTIVAGGLDARQRWAESRRRHHPYGSRAKPGRARGTTLALAAAQGHTLVCMRAGCSALVHLQSARRQARDAGRASLIIGDGCASASCTRGRLQPGRFAQRQMDMAEALRDGSRTLVLWPATACARIDLLVVPRALVLTKVEQIIGI